MGTTNAARSLRALLAALVVAAATALCVALPGQAWAAGNVAKIGDTEYASLQAAVDAANSGDTVQVISDVTLTDTDMTATDDGRNVMINVAGKDIKLDLNGKTIGINYTGGQYLYAAVLVADGAALTVTGNGYIDIPSNGENVAYMFWKRDTTGSLIVENGTYHMSDSADSMVYTNGDEIVTIMGGTWTLDALDDENSPWIFNVQGQGDNQIIVTGGTFNANIQRQKWANEVMVPVTHYVQDNGGTWTVKEGAALYAEEDILTGPYYIDGWPIGYASPEAFMAAANANTEDTIDLYDPVTLLTDVTVSGELTLAEEMVVDVDGKTINVEGALTAPCALTMNGGKINLSNANATVAAAEGLNVVTNLTNSRVVYENGTYSVVTDTVDGDDPTQPGGPNDGGSTQPGGSVEGDGTSDDKGESQGKTETVKTPSKGETLAKTSDGLGMAAAGTAALLAAAFAAVLIARRKLA